MDGTTKGRATSRLGLPNDLLAWLAIALWAPTACSGQVDGALRMEVITAYNFVVDSNVETPASYGPEAAHLGVRVCNTGTLPLTDVYVRIGDLTDPATGAGTPGVYPSRTIPVGQYDYSGAFALLHVAPAADATRYVPRIEPGECVPVYWLIRYPTKDVAGKTVAGAAADPTDDLWLNYDIWVQAREGAFTRRVEETRKVTLRNELSAMANKIWPNTTSKVPDEYLDAIQAQLGWRPDTANPRTGQSATIEGVWYDLGTVRKGFDNDGDLIPDYNAWLQPVGDPDLYDPTCWRLAKCYGIVIVKLNDGTELLIPFEDELYFENLPPNNTGAVGLVYYEFLPLRAGCALTLTPYQEVASGSDNEKFNGDYGSPGGSMTSTTTAVAFGKTGPASVALGGSVTYALTSQNTGTDPAGLPALGLPLLFEDTVPTGLEYVAGSATSNNTLPGGVTATVFYSTDNGASWLTTEPSPASGVNRLRWVLDVALPAGAMATVRFSATVPAGYATTSINNCGAVLMGGSSLATGCAVTLVQGPNRIEGTVFADNGAGAAFANGVRDTGEGGLNGVAVSLYYDTDGDGTAESLYVTLDSAGDSTYSFANLPDGIYSVVIEPQDPSVPATYGLTTVVAHLVSLDPTGINPAGVTSSNNNFGFAPPLSLDKTADALSVPESGLVTFTLRVRNHLYSEQESVGGGAPQNVYWVPLQKVQRAPLALGSVTDVNAATGVGTASQGIYVDRLGGYIYWADPSNNRILRDDLDPGTSGAPTVLLSGRNGPGYLAVDHAATGGRSYLYWSEVNGLYRADLGQNPLVPALRYTFTAAGAYGVAIDEENRWVYFVEKLSNTDYRLRRQNADGTGGTRDTSWEVALGNKEVSDIALDLANQRLYYTKTGTDKLFYADIVTQTASETFNIPNSWIVKGIAVDAANDRVYFSVANLSQIIARALSTGTDVATLTVGTTPGDVDVDPGSLVTSGTFDPDTTASFVTLRDSYPAAKLEFVSASIPPDSTTPVGTLTWNNIGPIFGRDSAVIDVTFRAGQTAANGNEILDNLAEVTVATLANGTPANRPSDTASVTLTPAGSITGRIWADANSNGWQPGTIPNNFGYDAGDRGIPSTVVYLDICEGTIRSQDSSCVGTQTTVSTTSDANGFYSFTGLRTDRFYRVRVDSATLPGTGITQTGDPEDDKVNGGNAGTCGGGGQSAPCSNSWDNKGSWFAFVSNSWRDAAGTAQGLDVSNINFGYAGTDAVVFGLVWLDLDGDGVKDSNEPYIQGATVALSGAAAATAVTGADGRYRFLTTSGGQPLPTGNYTVTVTLPSGQTWQWTYESPSNGGGVPNGHPLLNGMITFPLASTTEQSGSWDFGARYTGALEIGDRLYFDLNHNGSQDIGEGGINGATLRLYLDLNANGVVDTTDYLWGTTSTGVQGDYLFSSLPNGQFLVVVDETTLPAGYHLTADPDEAGVCAVCDGRGRAVLSGASDRTRDFGYAAQGVGSDVPLGQLGDELFLDSNADSRRQSGEAGIAGVTVTLRLDADGNGSYESVVATDITDGDGKYLFSNLADGRYQVVLDTADPELPTGTRAPTTPTTYTAIVSGGAVTVLGGTTCISDCSLGADFGYALRPSIGDYVFFDANGNGGYDLGETGIPGVQVELWSDANGDGIADGGAALATVATSNGSEDVNGDGIDDPLGFYQFTGLTPGQYYVVRVLPATLPSPMAQTADPDRDGIACGVPGPGLPACDHEDGNILLGYVSYTGADFGYQPPGAIGDFVWLDLDGDGVQDAGEPGLGGVTVEVTDGVTSLTTTTDSDGYYSFANLANGTWTVSLPGANLGPGGPLENLEATFDADGGGDLTARVVIANGTVGPTGNAWCLTGNCSLGLDFGLRLGGAYRLSGTICLNDARTSGICDDVDDFADDGTDLDAGADDETELSGIVVYLYTAAGRLIGSTTTDAQGNYSFGGLPAGDYRVVIGTTAVVFDHAQLTTTTGDTPASSVQDTGTSVIQNVTVLGADVVDVDYAFDPTVDWDFGDLPAAYGATTLTQDGARHIIPPGGPTVYLGTVLPDADRNGAGSAFADADDTLDGLDDEGGVVPWNVSSWSDAGGGAVQVTVNVPNGVTAYLVGWIDFNHDDTFLDEGEWILNETITGTGLPQVLTLPFDIPAGTIAAAEEAWLARFRIFAEAPTLPGFAYTGEATDGEVEDYLFRKTTGAAIGDLVWIDLDGDLVQDPNESGIGGVTVTLDGPGGPRSLQTSDGSQDVDGDGVIDPAGYYRFSGLDPGSYSVQITLAAGYAHSYDETGVPDGASTASLGAGEQHQTADFAVVPVSSLGLLGDLVFRDSDDDGLYEPGGGETGIEGLMVELYRSTQVPGVDLPLRTTATSATGQYTFADLPPGTYVVYLPTPPPTAPTSSSGATSGVDGQDNGTQGGTGQPVVSGSIAFGPAATDTRVDFGFVGGSDPTLAWITRVRAYVAGDRVMVEWRTASEVGAVSYDLYRRDRERQRWVKVNPERVPAVNSTAGGTYRVLDRSALAIHRQTYWIVELEESGRWRNYGPFELRAAGDAEAPEQERGAEATKARAQRLARAKALQRVESGASVPVLEGAGYLKLLTLQGGVHRVPAAEVARRLGLPVATVQDWIESGHLGLYHRAQPVAFVPGQDGSNLYFYAEERRDNYSEANVYWLAGGTNPGVPTVDGGIEAARPGLVYEAVLDEERDAQMVNTLSSDPAADYWVWYRLLAGTAGFDTARLSFRLSDLASDPVGGAELRLRLLGGSAGHHRVTATLNGEGVGTAEWDGPQPHVMSLGLSTAQLREGVNLLGVQALRAVDGSATQVYVDGFELRYPRYAVARGGSLEMAIEGPAAATLEGFGTPEVSVWEVSDPRRPKAVAGALMESVGAQWRVSFAAAAGPGRYVAFAAAATAVPAIQVVRPSDLSDSSRRASYVVIAPELLADRAGALAEYRRAQGLSAALVTLEAIYNEFSDGVASPDAIRVFLKVAFERWAVRPRYVVLVGDGTADYRDLLGKGDNLNPPLMVGTPFGLFASDSAYGDVNGDGVPEIAVGRIPVVSGEELAEILAKIQAYEARTGSGGLAALCVADDADGGGDFGADVEGVAALMERYGTQVVKATAAVPLQQTRLVIQDRLNEGVDLVNYFGHGGLDRLATEGLLTTADVPALENGHRLPVLVAMTCVAGQYNVPGHDCLAEELVRRADGGAVAAWVPSGLSIHADAVRLNRRFMRALDATPGRRLGDLVLEAMQGHVMADRPGSPPWIYNLIGDPALRLTEGGTR